VTNGFGVMSNVYDTLDLAANAAGVAFAVVIDFATARFLRTGEEQHDFSGDMD